MAGRKEEGQWSGKMAVYTPNQIIMAVCVHVTNRKIMNKHQ
jgi:hypothetical protein